MDSHLGLRDHSELVVAVTHLVGFVPSYSFVCVPTQVLLANMVGLDPEADATGLTRPIGADKREEHFKQALTKQPLTQDRPERIAALLRAGQST